MAGLIGTVETRVGATVIPTLRTTPEATEFQRLLAAMRDLGAEVVAAEVSSHALEMSRVAATRFEVAAFTNLSQDHLDFHGDMDSYESAKAQLALAEKTRAMNVRLLNEKFISQNAFDGTESSLSVAQGSVKSAEAQLRLAQNARRDATVAAPLSGIVAKRHVQPGEKVAFDAPLLTIVDLRDLELAANVPAVDVPELKVGMPVELAVDGYGDRRFGGRIERINPTTEPGTRSILVFVGLPNADAALKSGMFASGRIGLASSAPVPTLPLGAVRTEAGQSYVWTVDDGKLSRRLVTLGRRDDEAGRVEIRTPLPAGAPVLAARFDNLKEGAPALVKSPSSSSNATSPRPAGAARPAG